MKTPTNIKAILSSILLLFIAVIMSQSLFGQESQYRVTAFKNGNNQVMSVSNEVAIIPAALIYIPNAFTPNGDGLNDSFGCKGEGLTDYNMQVFDRWGNMIFESNDMKNHWDGYYQNELAPTGVYVYKINAKGPGINGKSKRIINENGTVTLVL